MCLSRCGHQSQSGSRGAATTGRQKGRARTVYQNLNIHQAYSGRLYLSRRTLQVTDGHFLYQSRFQSRTEYSQTTLKELCNIWDVRRCHKASLQFGTTARHKVGAALQYFNCHSNDDSKLSQTIPAQLRTVHASFPDR